MGPSLEEFASRTDALRELVGDAPLGSWAEVLGSDELRNLHELSKAATELHGAARKFDGFLLESLASYLHEPIDNDVASWQSAFQDAKLVQPFATEALFASPSFTWATDSFRDVRYNSPVVEYVVEHPPITYTEVLAMVERAERHYAECTCHRRCPDDPILVPLRRSKARSAGAT